MRSRNSIRSRLLALSMSTLVASTGAACFLYFREPPPTGQLEDDGWFGHLLDRRSVPLASRPTTGEELLVPTRPTAPRCSGCSENASTKPTSEERGIPHVDLRRAFGESDECYYWDLDSHINLRGHEAVAEQLLAIIAGLLAG